MCVCFIDREEETLPADARQRMTKCRGNDQRKTVCKRKRVVLRPEGTGSGQVSFAPCPPLRGSFISHFIHPLNWTFPGGSLSLAVRVDERPRSVEWQRRGSVFCPFKSLPFFFFPYLVHHFLMGSPSLVRRRPLKAEDVGEATTQTGVDP